MYLKCTRHRHTYIIPSSKCISNVHAIDIHILYHHSNVFKMYTPLTYIYYIIIQMYFKCTRHRHTYIIPSF